MNEREIDEIRENGWRDVTPAGDQIDAALAADEHYSPAQSFHPDIRAAVDTVRDVPQTVPDMRWLEEQGFRYAHSNLPGRKALPPNYGNECECCPDGLIGYDLNVAEIDEAEKVAEFRVGVQASIAGPFGLRNVVLVDPAAPAYSAPLPWAWRDEDGSVSPAHVAFPVMHGYSPMRIARQVMDQYASVCHWKGKRSKVEHPTLECDGTPDWAMLISSGSTTYVFPTCGTCRWELGKDVTPEGWGKRLSSDGGQLDYISNDGWFVAAGYPADERI